jgi:hypothetical protein
MTSILKTFITAPLDAGESLVCRLRDMTGRNMQTISMISLATVALIVAVFDLRELFIAWYSEVTPSLSWSNYVTGGMQIALCTLVALLTVLRLAFQT